MKAVILVAGLGSRLRPYTNALPKALVPVNGTPLLDYQLSSLRKRGINNISLVTGYLPDAFEQYQFPCFYNEQYANSNMVYSLMRARVLFDGKEDLLVCYGDIVYNQDTLNRILDTQGSLVVSADLDWLSLWKLRMEDPFSDAESFVMEKDSHKIVSLGQSITTDEDAQAQYIGLLKVSAAFQNEWLTAFDQMPASKSQNLYMTDFIQSLIDNGHDVTASLHSGGWLEVDSVEDKACYESSKKIKALLDSIKPGD